MKKMLALEELAQFGLSLFFIHQLTLPFSYVFILYFFLPDAFAVGYLINRTVGAALYNFSHHKGIAIIIVSLGLITEEWVLLAGLLMYAHGSFDRAIGYGLKYIDSPDHTHLGFIGKQKHLNPPDHF
jgi:hypothetical protein